MRLPQHPEGPEEHGGVEADDLLRLGTVRAVLLEEDLEVAAVLNDEIGLAVPVEVSGFDMVGPRAGFQEDGVVGGVLQGQDRSERQNHEFLMLTQ